MGMDGCILLLFKVMNRCEVVLLNMRWDLHVCGYYLSSIRVRPLLDRGDDWSGGGFIP